MSEGATGSTSNGGGIFYSGSDNKLHITCGTNSTTKRITINRDDGLDGIGSDAPTHNLDIHASGNTYLKLLRSGYNPVYIGNAAGEGVIETTGATFFKTGGSERFRVNSDGNVAIGNNPTVHADTIFHIEDSGETNVKIEGSMVDKAITLMDCLDSHDDVQNIYSNLEFEEQVLN